MNYRFYKLFTIGFVLLLSSSTSKAGILKPEFSDTAILGRWDIVIHDGGKIDPSWMEINLSGNKWLTGRFVGIVGSARPVSVFHYKDSILSFTLPPQWEREDNDITFKGKYSNGRLSGMMTASNGKSYQWTAEKAPLLIRTSSPSWGKPVTLFDGKTMNGWEAKGKNQWIAEGGVLKSPHSGANLVTLQKFDDFKLHIEFRCPAGSNSGIYLRGRYEVQIEDSRGKEPAADRLGAIYGFIVPTENAGKGPDEWQSYDITLVGRRVTVVLNGRTIICDRPIPGITGGALDSREGEAGPIYLQGDHGPIEYRNIVLTPAR